MTSRSMKNRIRIAFCLAVAGCSLDQGAVSQEQDQGVLHERSHVNDVTSDHPARGSLAVLVSENGIRCTGSMMNNEEICAISVSSLQKQARTLLQGIKVMTLFGADASQLLLDATTRPFCDDAWTQTWLQSPSAESSIATAFHFDAQDLRDTLGITLPDADGDKWMMSAGHAFQNNEDNVAVSAPRYAVFYFDNIELFDPDTMMGAENKKAWDAWRANPNNQQLTIAALSMLPGFATSEDLWLSIRKANVVPIDESSIVATFDPAFVKPDVSLFKLKDAPLHATMLKVREETLAHGIGGLSTLQMAESVSLLGFPWGATLKEATNGTPQSETENFFMTNISTLSGNSGSPVFVQSGQDSFTANGIVVGASRRPSSGSLCLKIPDEQSKDCDVPLAHQTCLTPSAIDALSSKRAKALRNSLSSIGDHTLSPCWTLYQQPWLDIVARSKSAKMSSILKYIKTQYPQ